MKIEACSNFPRDNGTYSFPLGSVDRKIIHIGSIALDRKGDGGQISEARAKALLAEAIMCGAEIKIEFDNVVIALK